MENSDKYLPYITGLISATNEKKIKWAQENAITFFVKLVSSYGENAIISIQSILFDDFIFQVGNTTRNETVIIINTNTIEFRELKEPLYKLFSTIQSNFEKEKFNFLDDLLNRL
jgi:hypothetical protein